MFKAFAFVATVTFCGHAASTLAVEKVYRDFEAVKREGTWAEVVHADFSDVDYPSKVLDLLRVMPRLKTLVVGGPRYADEQFDYLAEHDSLRALVLDSTDVTDEAIAEIREKRPELVIHRSQRRAIGAIRSLALEAGVVTRANEDFPELADLLGKRHFEEATEVTFHKLPDEETGPFDKILNEELAPLRMLPRVEKLDLTWTRINDGGLYYLKNLKSLRSLRLPVDEISAEGRQRLRERKGLQKLEGTENGKYVLQVDK